MGGGRDGLPEKSRSGRTGGGQGRRREAQGPWTRDQGWRASPHCASGPTPLGGRSLRNCRCFGGMQAGVTLGLCAGPARGAPPGGWAGGSPWAPPVRAWRVLRERRARGSRQGARANSHRNPVRAQAPGSVWGGEQCSLTRQALGATDTPSVLSAAPCTSRAQGRPDRSSAETQGAPRHGRLLLPAWKGRPGPGIPHPRGC